MEGPRHQHLHQEWQEPLEERVFVLCVSGFLFLLFEHPSSRQPRGDTRVTPEDKRRAVAQRAAEIAERRAVFDANNNN